jgi:hypothetical protein
VQPGPGRETCRERSDEVGSYRSGLPKLRTADRVGGPSHPHRHPARCHPERSLPSSHFPSSFEGRGTQGGICFSSLSLPAAPKQTQSRRRASSLLNFPLLSPLRCHPALRLKCSAAAFSAASCRCLCLCLRRRRCRYPRPSPSTLVPTSPSSPASASPPPASLALRVRARPQSCRKQTRTAHTACRAFVFCGGSAAARQLFAPPALLPGGP